MTGLSVNKHLFGCAKSVGPRAGSQDLNLDSVNYSDQLVPRARRPARFLTKELLLVCVSFLTLYHAQAMAQGWCHLGGSLLQGV